MVAGEGAGRGQRSRRELTTIAINCFSLYGFQGTSIDRIAREAGVTKGAIYYHFRDKEALLAAAVEDRVREFEDRVQRACEGAGPADALRRIAEVCIHHAKSGDYPRFTIKLMVESIGTNDRVSAQLRDMMRRFRAFVRNIISSGQERGVFSGEIDAKAAAASYTSGVLGAEIQYYQDPERMSLEQTVGVYLEQLLSGLEQNPGRTDETDNKDDNEDDNEDRE